MKKEEFLKKYYEMDLKSLANEFSCSISTIYRKLREYDIPLKGNSTRDFSYLKNRRKSSKIIIDEKPKRNL